MHCFLFSDRKGINFIFYYSNNLIDDRKCSIRTHICSTMITVIVKTKYEDGRMRNQ